MGYLAIVIYIITTLVLTLLWFIVTKNTIFSPDSWAKLLESLIPNLLSPLLSFLLIFFVFIRKGIDIENLARNGRWLKEGFESFDDIDWTPKLKSCEKMVIVAFFFEEWLDLHKGLMISFLKNEKSRLVIYLPDYTNNELVNKIHSIIPEHPPEELITKIKQSIKIIKEISQNKAQDVSISLYKETFQYTYQQFDKELILTLNQHSRATKFKSPFLAFDLSKSKNLDDFYAKETNALEASSDKINIQKWKE